MNDSRRGSSADVVGGGVSPSLHFEKSSGEVDG